MSFKADRSVVDDWLNGEIDSPEPIESEPDTALLIDCEGNEISWGFDVRRVGCKTDYNITRVNGDQVTICPNGQPNDRHQVTREEIATDFIRSGLTARTRVNRVIDGLSAHS